MGKLPVIRPVQPQPQPQQAPLPVLGFGPSPSPTGWRFIKRYTINPAAADTSGFGDILLPPGASHAMIEWIARDTSANAGWSVGGIQLATGGGAIDTGPNYFWADDNANTIGAVAPSANNGGGATTSWGAVWEAGGGGAATLWNRGTIWLPFYNPPPGVPANAVQMAHWQFHIAQAGSTFALSGGGYYSPSAGPANKVRALSGAASFAAGTTFDLFAA